MRSRNTGTEEEMGCFSGIPEVFAAMGGMLERTLVVKLACLRGRVLRHTIGKRTRHEGNSRSAHHRSGCA